MGTINNVKGALSVQEAAGLLGVSGNQVGRLIQAGELEAERFGPVWAVGPASVRRRAALRPRRGRPLAPRSAWTRLRDVSAAEVGDVEDVIGLAVTCRRRAEGRSLRALPAVLEDVLADPCFVISGAMAGERLGAAVEGLPPHDLYVRRSDVDPVVAAHRMRDPESGSEANVCLRVVEDEVWPFEEGERVVWPIVAAVDLVDALDHRSAAELVTVFGRS